MRKYTKEAAVIALVAACLLAVLVQAVGAILSILGVLLVLVFVLNPFGVLNRVFSPPARIAVGSGTAILMGGILFGLTWGTASIVIGGAVAGTAIIVAALVLNPWLKCRDAESVKRICRTMAEVNTGKGRNPGPEWSQWIKTGYSELRTIMAYYGYPLTADTHIWMAVPFVLGMVTANKTGANADRLGAELKTAKQRLEKLMEQLESSKTENEELGSECARLRYEISELKSEILAWQSEANQANQMAKVYAVELGIGREEADDEIPWEEVTPEHVRALIAGGMTLTEIAGRYGKNVSTVSRKAGKAG